MASPDLEAHAPRVAVQRPTTTARIVALRAGAPAELRDDELATEEPIEIRIGGQAATVIMRTPGDDEELARGFLYGEGLITSAADVEEVARPEGLPLEEVGNVLDVRLAPRLVSLGPPSLQRSFFSSSSCGVCGKSSLAALEIAAARPVGAEGLRVTRAVLAALPDRLREAQATFHTTGGLHAAGLFDTGGALLAAREDVGRHNAVDKVIGWALAEGRLPASTAILQVSGRTSFEILQKAIVAGVPVVSAVSAPSSLAVALAERHGVTLVGFSRGGSMNVYSRPERITG